jgi:ATP:guanido phosphotransferase, N-terminal domain
MNSLPTQSLLNSKKITLKKIHQSKYELKSTLVIGISEGLVHMLHGVHGQAFFRRRHRRSIKGRCEEGRGRAKKERKKEAEIMGKYPVFEETNTTLIENILNKDIWKHLSEVKTSNGFQLIDCVKCGIQGEKIGAATLDSECYEKFGQIFNEITKLLRMNSADFDLEEDLKPIISKMSAATHIVKEGYFIWEFNFIDLKFPSGLPKNEIKDSNDKIKELLAKVVGSAKLNKLSSSQLKDTAAMNYLIQKANKIQNIKDNWSEDKDVYEENDQYLLINAVNHVALIEVTSNAPLSSKAVSFLTKMESIVQSVGDKIAQSANIGLKNVYPVDSGNGLNCNIAITLPALAEKGVSDANINTIANGKDITLQWSQKATKFSKEMDTLLSTISKLKDKENDLIKDECALLIKEMVDNAVKVIPNK